MVVNTQILLGIDHSFIDFCTINVPLHKNVVKAFQKLQQDAAIEGYQLTIASGFRSFDRQLKIWNEKVQGIRPVCGDDGRKIDLQQLDDWQQVQAILRWSALPGASRHHWGTDLDIYDRAAVAEDYQLQLTADEAEEGGPFYAMHCWLDHMIERDLAHGFYRPYSKDRGGVAPERWHISYAPLADNYQSLLTIDVLEQAVKGADMAQKATVLEHLDEIYQRYVKLPD